MSIVLLLGVGLVLALVVTSDKAAAGASAPGPAAPPYGQGGLSNGPSTPAGPAAPTPVPGPSPLPSPEKPATSNPWWIPILATSSQLGPGMLQEAAFTGPPPRVLVQVWDGAAWSTPYDGTDAGA